MLSIVFPIYNRTDLFKHTLQSLSAQTLPYDEYEVVVVNDGGKSDRLLPTLAAWRDAGMQIRYCEIDVKRLPFPVFQFHGANNPAAALNIGIKGARYDKVVLTSPEIMHSKQTNLMRLDSWPLDPNQLLVADVFDPSLVNFEPLKGWIGGGVLKRVLHFLLVAHKDFLVNIGGFDERFVEGWGAEDVEFVDRVIKNGGQYLFTGPSVLATHQPHPRADAHVPAAHVRANELAALMMGNPKFMVANPGHEWGSDSLIVHKEWWD